MNDVLLLLGGELRRPALARSAARGAAVLCADGGVRHAAALGLRPRLVIGDMDSLPRKLPAWRDAVYLCDFDPDRSDFEKCLLFCLERGVRRVRVAGATGGRLDHTLVNLALAEKYSGRMRISLLDQEEAVLLGPGVHRFAAAPGRTASLLAVSSPCRVTTSGLRYPLRREFLERGSRGLSNVALARRVRVTVHQGRLWALGLTPA